MIQVGQVLDKYELLERVGQGGMAIVYRGIDRTLKRTVAVKILHKHLSDYQEARDRFEREAQAVARLLVVGEVLVENLDRDRPL